MRIRFGNVKYKGLCRFVNEHLEIFTREEIEKANNWDLIRNFEKTVWKMAFNDGQEIKDMHIDLDYYLKELRNEIDDRMHYSYFKLRDEREERERKRNED